jgi:hypothetical protein
MDNSTSEFAATNNRTTTQLPQSNPNQKPNPKLNAKEVVAYSKQQLDDYN